MDCPGICAWPFAPHRSKTVDGKLHQIQLSAPVLALHDVAGGHAAGKTRKYS